MGRYNSVRKPSLQDNYGTYIQPQASQQQEEEIPRNEGGSRSTTPTSESNSTSSGGEPLKNMVDQKGFLVCTQLVKTGGADMAGLKAGDVFTRFGNIRKENFEGLKSVANFVRRSANKTFQAVVLRKVKRSNNKSGARLHKVKLSLTPLNCQDT